MTETRAPLGDVGLYRDRITHLAGSRAQFAGLYATGCGKAVRAMFVDASGEIHIETQPVADGTAASIVDLIPAANWDEREAHDQYGITFVGHHPLRPLSNHDPALESWTVPVRGHDPYQIAVGPTHAGIIESGHFRFHVVGDRILHLDTRLFYKHRGLERAAQGAALSEAIRYPARACMACSVANTVAYAAACESALGQETSNELARVRTILVELERVWNHLNDIAAICAGVGLAAGNQAFAALTEQARRLNHTLTGHRFLAGAIQVGASSVDWDTPTMAGMAAALSALRRQTNSHWRELMFNTSLQDRLDGVGTLDAAQAERLGAVGPAARAAGVDRDERTRAPHLLYDGFTPVTPEQATGDVRARFEQRALELWQTFDLLDTLVSRPVRGVEANERVADSKPLGVGMVESPRGRTICVVEQQGGRIARLHLRTGSYANWPAVAAVAADNLLPDFPLINKSFELCYACADR